MMIPEGASLDVRFVLVDGGNGELYLLGVGPPETGQTDRPTFWRVQSAAFASLEESHVVSSMIRERLEASVVSAPGISREDHIGRSFLQTITLVLTKLLPGPGL